MAAKRSELCKFGNNFSANMIGEKKKRVKSLQLVIDRHQNEVNSANFSTINMIGEKNV